MSLTSEERKALAIECGFHILNSGNMATCSLNSLAKYTTAVEARGDERVAQLEEALGIAHKYMNHLPTFGEDRAPVIKALSTSSGTWLADKIKEAEVKVLGNTMELLEISQAIYQVCLEKYGCANGITVDAKVLVKYFESRGTK